MGSRKQRYFECKYLCVSDPAGLFVGRALRLLDLRLSEKDQVWQPGTIFKNIHTGHVLIMREDGFKSTHPGGSWVGIFEPGGSG